MLALLLDPKACAALLVAGGLGYGAGRLEQWRRDDLAAKVEALEAATLDLERANMALQKARDDAAAIVLRQAEATTRERDSRLAAERRGRDLETDARDREARLEAELAKTCPDPVPAVAPASAPASPAARCGYADDELARLRKAFPPGPIRRAGNAAAAR